MTESMTWDGRNSRDVREWLEGPNPAFRRWVLRNAGGFTQAWHYIREEDWDAKVRAAVWDPSTETWLPVRRGDEITRHEDGSVYVATVRPHR